MGLTFELWWYDTELGRSICENYSQQQNTHFQCDYAYFDGRYAKIVAIAMSDANLNICLPCVMR